MKRLIEKGLMFGELVHVGTPALVARYNRALKKLTGRQTALPDFYVDISGYSPEVADELDDPLYLNPNGVNRQFILLSTAQKNAPLLDAKFSTTRSILQEFIRQNESELFALTTRDAVAGELANAVFDAATPERLFDIRRIKVEADTTGSHVAEARKLAEKIARFTSEADAWWDDVLIAEMIELAKVTGDVTHNPINLRPLSTDIRNFWTSHFGGLYVFRDVDHPAAISTQPKDSLGKLPIAYQFDLADHNRIARFLQLNQLAEPIVRVKSMDAAAVLAQKMDFILVDAAAAAGIDLGVVDRRALRRAAHDLGAGLPAEFHALAALKSWADAGGPWPSIKSNHPAYFYTLRAAPGPDADLVNQLLAELAPLDVRQLYLCHKTAFYRAYRSWPDAKRQYVANYLAAEVQMDADGARRTLFGEEPAMDRPSPWAKAERRRNELVNRVGPWGSLNKGKRR